MNAIEATAKREQIVGELAAALSTDTTLRPLDLLPALRKLLKCATPLAEVLTDRQRTGSGERYERDILYTHPDGHFSIMLLTWQHGQRSPVHCHWTWCGYLVLQGTLSEDHFGWEEDKLVQVGGKLRRVGDIVVGESSLHDVHRLGNLHQETAVSLHIYGVGKELIPTHINRVFDRFAWSKSADA
ncbi:cysteine dioxygenase family protein [Paraburkholderia sp. J8-2]|uniref:cysteine dioxygenase family protein n=1 Tax=Paraburkholderia sp. J8-2 TaxID=2805440 RepID=UPI002AB76B2E|nr:cysteine dioxygenase family protein [Paraburkholderia sp. J8-2]